MDNINEMDKYETRQHKINTMMTWWWWWFSAQRQVHWLLRHPGMRWVRWFPIAFLTDNDDGWATCPRLASGRLEPATVRLQVTEHTVRPAWPH